MQGFVLAYRPAARAGAILSEEGELFTFADPATTLDIEGGDVVSFVPAMDSFPARGRPRVAGSIHLVEKGFRLFSEGSSPARHVWRELQLAPPG